MPPVSLTARQRLVLFLVLTDRTWECRGGEWFGKCIHCGTRIRASAAGDLLGNTSIEHIVPRSHGGSDDHENLALACASCNSAKGRRQDLAGPGDAGYEKMVALLRQRKSDRRRELNPEAAARLRV